MRRLEYMTILRQKLIDGGLSNDEVNDALEFYEELFLDGGYENEEKTAMNLGDPEKLAAQILAENGAVGFVKQPEPKIDDVIDNRGQQQQNSAASAPVDPGYDIAPDNRKTALIIIVLASSIVWVPVLIGLTAGAFGLAIGGSSGSRRRYRISGTSCGNTYDGRRTFHDRTWRAYHGTVCKDGSRAFQDFLPVAWKDARKHIQQSEIRQGGEQQWLNMMQQVTE